ncbi:MAG: hypothetical protein OXC40_03200 [Proteobacteria bacterium]|nr:hypothetical protein [Pseudomonadota bacterium]
MLPCLMLALALTFWHDSRKNAAEAGSSLMSSGWPNKKSLSESLGLSEWQKWTQDALTSEVTLWLKQEPKAPPHLTTTFTTGMTLALMKKKHTPSQGITLMRNPAGHSVSGGDHTTLDYCVIPSVKVIYIEDEEHSYLGLTKHETLRYFTRDKELFLLPKEDTEHYDHCQKTRVHYGL